MDGEDIDFTLSYREKEQQIKKNLGKNDELIHHEGKLAAKGFLFNKQFF